MEARAEGAGSSRRAIKSIRSPPLSERRAYAALQYIGIEHALHMPIERPESRDPRELDRAAAFGGARYQLRCCKDDWNAAFE
jgi:hypothetical protein